MVLYGTASGMPSDLGAKDLGQGSYFLTQAAGKDYSRTTAERGARTRELLELAAAGSLKVEIGEVRPLEEAAAALEAMESRTAAAGV